MKHRIVKHVCTWTLLTVAFCVFVVVLAGRLMAHQKLASDAWIDKERSRSGDLCCYAGQDCHPVPAEHVKPHPKGVQLSELYGSRVIPNDQIQVSKDGQYWLCASQARMRCFFAPYSGS